MPILEHVRKGEIPSARKENERIDAINSLSDRLNTLYTGPVRAGGMMVTISNTTSSDIQTGGVLAVTGVRVSGSFDKMKACYMKGSVPLTGAAAAADSPLIAIALEGIPAGAIGRALVPDLYGVVAEQANANHNLIKKAAGKLTTTDNGIFRILGKSTASNSLIFAFVYRMAAGHRVATTSNMSGTGSSWTANVTIDGLSVPVKCPLLASGKSIANSSTVVVSWNETANEWQIIETACS